MFALNSVGPSWHHDHIRSSSVAWLRPGHRWEGGGITPPVSLCEENEFSRRNLNSSNNLKKPQLPEGHFDAPEDSNLEKVPLTKFQIMLILLTKEKGGPRDPEPTQNGAWK